MQLILLVISIISAGSKLVKLKGPIKNNILE